MVDGFGPRGRQQTSLRVLRAFVVDLIAFALLAALAVACCGQCYIDPATGQQVCPQQQPAAAVPPRWPDPTVVYIDGYTGTLIEIGGQRCFALTCGHGPEHVGATVTVVNRFCYRFQATCIACDDEHDLAILRIPVPAQYTATIAQAPPAPGTPLTMTGFGGGRFHIEPLAAGYVAGGVNVGAGNVIPGDSGGPIRNANNEVVGVVSGTDLPDAPNAYYAKLSAIHAIIEQVRASVQAAGSGPGAGSGEQGVQPPPAPQVAPPKIVEAPPARVQQPPLIAPPAQPPSSYDPPDVPPLVLPPAGSPLPAPRSLLGRLAAGGATKLLLAVGIPTGVAAIAAPLLVWLGRRAARKELARIVARHGKTGADQSVVTFHADRECAGPIERDATEARQLLRLGELEGRAPLLDALAGQLTRSRLERDAEHHDDANIRQYAKDMTHEIDRRFNEIAPAKYTLTGAA